MGPKRRPAGESQDIKSLRQEICHIKTLLEKHIEAFQDHMKDDRENFNALRVENNAQDVYINRMNNLMNKLLGGLIAANILAVPILTALLISYLI